MLMAVSSLSPARIKAETRWFSTLVPETPLISHRVRSGKRCVSTALGVGGYAVSVPHLATALGVGDTLHQYRFWRRRIRCISTALGVGGYAVSVPHLA
eukprot:3241001-Rhodomonas_salina.2